jgi:c-di-GMP-binding flagellar brake protein YcgR
MCADVYYTEVMAERSHFQRKPLNLRVHFQLVNYPEDNAPRNSSRTENISAGGLALYSEKKMKNGQQLLITLFLPPEKKRAQDLILVTCIEQECIPVVIHAQVVWKLPFMADKFAYGVEFLSIEPDNKKEFQKFLQDFYLHKPNVIGQ